MTTIMNQRVRCDRIRWRRGFTFLEIAISLAIISVVFVSLITLFNTTIGLDDYTNKLTKATFLAQRIMTEKELGADFELGEGEEVVLEDEYEGYSYKINVRETLLPLIQEVTLTVFFSSLMREHTLRVTTYVTGLTGSMFDEGGIEETK